MQDRRGRPLFCPFGIFGKCYVISTPERAAEIARFDRWFARLGTLVTVIVMGLYGALYGFAVCGVLLLIFALKCRQWMSEMVVCDPELVPEFGEIRPENWTRRGKARLASLLCFSAVGLGGAVLLLVNGMILLGMTVFLMSGIGVTIFGWKLLLVFKTPAPGEPPVRREG